MPRGCSLLPDIKHSTTVVVADDPTYPVGTGEWNDDHWTSLQTTAVLDQFTRMVLPSTDRLTAAGASHVRVTEYPVAFMGSQGIAPTIVDGNYLLQYKRASLSGSARASIAGTGELFLFDLAPVGRLILAGRGG
jgi:hypothetical protein